MSKLQQERVKGLDSLIGKTPLVKITYKFKGELRTLFAKAEYFNLTGSIKDRMAYHIIKRAYADGEIKEGDRIVEATSGNTGIAFSAVGRFMGHPVTIYMPNWMSVERMSIIGGYGADIKLVSSEQGGFLGSVAMAEEEAKSDPNVFLPRQFDNNHNCEAHYQSTAPEIWEQLASIGVKIDAFVAGVGTGGTVMGVAKFLKEKDPTIKVHPMEPANSPTLRTGHKVGKHRIQGISDEFIPSIVKLDELDEIISVDDGDGIVMAQKLAKNLGLGIGISSGANFIAAVMLQNENPNATVVTVFADDNKKYLSTDYAKCEPIKDDFLSSHIELVSMEAIKFPV